jgi:signal peptidase I
LPSGEQPRTLSQVDPELRKEATAKIRPRYPLRDNLERPDWPVSVPLSDAPLWVSRSTYEAGTAVGTLLFSLTSLLLAATIAYFVQFVSVPSPSMVPTLNPGNVVLVTRSLTFRVGDVVLFIPPPSVDKVTKDISERIDAQPTSTKGQKFIKRVVAVPGERVGVRNSSPFVQVSERKFRFDVVGPYARPEIFPKSSWDRPPEELKRGEYFVSGDNGFRSVDSRVWGPLEGKYVIGKARCIVWPLDQVGIIKPGEIIEVVKGDE